MRTTIDLPDDLFRRVKARAAMEGTTMKDYVIARLRHSLETVGHGQDKDEWTSWQKRWDGAGRGVRARKRSAGKSASAILTWDRNAR
ncbi:MAG: hypothetical protein HY042_04630 [Spirochaetia bacterium]|nr:hypothetical protein [Spirochaetia bacterium]